MVNTDKITVVTQYWVDKIQASRVTLGMPTSADVVNVFYGDQEIITATPCVCVEPDNKKRVFNGDMRRTRVDFNIGILIYTGVVTDPQTNRKNADTLAENIEALIHADNTFGKYPNNLVISSLVDTVESGYVRKGGSLLRSARIMITAESQVILPPNP